ETKKLLDSGGGYIYLDVRTTREFEYGHVPGAKNVPVFQQDAYGNMMPNPDFVGVVEKNFGKDAKIIAACQKGGRSLRAAEILAGAGFTNVVDMIGGFGDGWMARGFPVTADCAPDERYEDLAKK